MTKTPKKVILTRDDGVVRVLKKKTVEALEESRSGKKLKSFANVKELMKDLNS